MCLYFTIWPENTVFLTFLGLQTEVVTNIGTCFSHCARIFYRKTKQCINSWFIRVTSHSYVPMNRKFDIFCNTQNPSMPICSQNYVHQHNTPTRGLQSKLKIYMKNCDFGINCDVHIHNLLHMHIAENHQSNKSWGVSRGFFWAKTTLMRHSSRWV